MTIVDQMEALARKYHDGQLRKDGKTPYVAHPAAVVARLRSWGIDESKGTEDAVSLAVAWGHDLLEDTKIPESDILSLGELGGAVLNGIKLLTFSPLGKAGLSDEEYDQLKAEYIKGIARTALPEVLLVKIADRLCNAQDFVKLYRYDKAKSYVRAGSPLFAETTRIRESLRTAVDDDIRKTMAEIDKIVADDEAWERLSGGSGLPEDF